MLSYEVRRMSGEIRIWRSYDGMLILEPFDDPKKAHRFCDALNEAVYLNNHTGGRPKISSHIDG